MNLQIAEFLDDSLLDTTGSISLWIKIPLIITLFAIFIISTYFAFKKELPPTPTESLIAAINKMKDMNQEGKAEEKEIYFLFIDSLKKYLKHEFMINIDAKIDSEITKTLELHDFDPTLTKELGQIIERAYQTRFAHAQTSRDNISKDIFWLFNLINQATIRPPHTLPPIVKT